MNGQAKLLVKYLDGSDTRFIIPVYQRNYDWKTNHCKQLYDDLKKVIDNSKTTHFFGSIVSVVNTEGASSELLIIDGQQRITTVSLFLLAIVNLLKEGKIFANQASLCKKIEDNYLVDEYQPEDKKVKLKPIKDDQEAFLKLFGNKDDYDMTSNVTQNYLYFYNRICKDLESGSKLSADDFFRAICALQIIDISLDPTKDDAQLIFESLNSTGLELNEGDKIRNYILMGLSTDKQEKYYNSYWNKMEQSTNYEVSGFVRHYLTVNLGRVPSIKTIYAEFKEYVENRQLEILPLLEDMTKYAKHYQNITQSSTGQKDIDRILKRLNTLGMSVSFPYLLTLLDYKATGKIDDHDVAEILKTLETFIFRRLICGVPTNALNKIFAQLHRECLRLLSEDVNYADVLKYVLISKSSSGRMPHDHEFLLSFEEKDVYSMSQKNKMYIFDRLENQDTVEHTNVSENMQDGIYTIEHIMPRTLSESWRQALGDDYERVYDIWLNRIANLTLTGYNSQYSNRPFTDKRDTENGFKDSHLHLNSFVSKCDKWTETEIKQRNEELKKLFLKLWPYPHTDFKPPAAVSDTHYLDEDYDYKGKRLLSFSFMDTPYATDSWSDMYQQVVKLLLERDSTIIYKFARSQDRSGLAYHFVTVETEGYTKIDNKLFLYTASSTMSKINTLKRIFEDYQLDGSELVFEIGSW